MITEFNAICIRAVDYKDNDKLLTLITPENGKITAQIRSVKSPKSKLKIAASPFCFAEYSLAEKNGRYTVTGVQTKENFFNIWQDLDKYAAAEIAIESIDKTTMDKADSSNEFILLLQALYAINYGEVYPYAVSLWLLSNLLIGMGIDVMDYMECGFKTMVLIERLSKVGISHIDNQDITKEIALIEGLAKIGITHLECQDITQEEVIRALYFIEQLTSKVLKIKINSLTPAIEAMEKNISNT